MKLTSDQLDACAGTALLCGDLKYCDRLRVAMDSGDVDEAEHVTALMIAILYGRGDVENAKVAGKRWQEAFHADL